MEIDKEEQEMGSECEWERHVIFLLNRVVREGLPAKGTFQPRPEGGEGREPGMSEGRAVQAERTASAKALRQVCACLME